MPDNTKFLLIRMALAVAILIVLIQLVIFLLAEFPEQEEEGATPTSITSSTTTLLSETFVEPDSTTRPAQDPATEEMIAAIFDDLPLDRSDEDLIISIHVLGNNDYYSIWYEDQIPMIMSTRAESDLKMSFYPNTLKSVYLSQDRCDALKENIEKHKIGINNTMSFGSMLRHKDISECLP